MTQSLRRTILYNMHGMHINTRLDDYDVRETRRRDVREHLYDWPSTPRQSASLVCERAIHLGHTHMSSIHTTNNDADNKTRCPSGSSESHSSDCITNGIRHARYTHTHIARENLLTGEESCWFYGRMCLNRAGTSINYINSRDRPLNASQTEWTPDSTHTHTHPPYKLDIRNWAKTPWRLLYLKLFCGIVCVSRFPATI